MKFSGPLQLALALALALVIAPVRAQDGQGTSPLSIGKGGTAALTAAGARTNLGLGSIATQNSNNVAITGGTITGVPTPSNPTDAASKSYVDATATGLNILAPSALATAAVLPNTPTYANGASGVGATLTAGSNTTLTVDGTAAPLSTVVLVKNQASAFQNGVYTVTQAGSGAAPWILTRAAYFDQAAEMKAGSYTFVTSGAANINSAYTLQTAVATVGTDPSNWALFSRAPAFASYSTVTGASTTYTNSQCQFTVSRSNSASPMIDTLPGTGAGVLSTGCLVTISNNDASALLALQVAAGAAIKGNLAATGFIYLCPQQSLTLYSDGANYFITSQPSACALQANTTFYAAPSGGSATNHGLSAASPLNTMTNAYNLARQIVFASGKTVTIQSANGTYTDIPQIFDGPINGQVGTDTQSSVFPVVIQGDTATPSNVVISNGATGVGTCCDAITVANGASLLVQGFTLFSGHSNTLIANQAKAAFKFITFQAAASNHITSTHHSMIEVAGNYTIQGDASGHWLVSDASSIYVQTAATITISGSHGFSNGVATGQYSGSNIVFNATPTFVGSLTSGLKCFMTLNAILSGVSLITVGSGSSASSGGQCT